MAHYGNRLEEPKRVVVDGVRGQTLPKGVPGSNSWLALVAVWHYDLVGG